MNLDEEKKNIPNTDCLRFIYNEVCESYKVQESSINLLNTKFNWLMVSEIAVTGFIINKISISSPIVTVSLTLLLISLIISIVSLWSLSYARGPKLSELTGAGTWTLENLISKTSEKISRNIDSNNQILIKLTLQLKISIILFLLGLILSIVKFL